MCNKPHFTILQAPEVFMTDNSRAEKAALLQAWPTAKQLLCHFHVAQAEWRWLTAAQNKVDRDQRRHLMSAFQMARYFHIRVNQGMIFVPTLATPHKSCSSNIALFLLKLLLVPTAKAFMHNRQCEHSPSTYRRGLFELAR